MIPLLIKGSRFLNLVNKNAPEVANLSTYSIFGTFQCLLQKTIEALLVCMGNDTMVHGI
jgi:hypothetical protein